MEWNKEFDLGQETLLRLPKRSEIFCHILPKQLSTNIQCLYSKTNQKKYSKILVAFVRMGESDDSVLFSFTFFVLSNGRQKVWCGEVRSQTFAVEIQRLLKCNPSDQHLKNIAVSTHTKMQNN